MNETLFTYLHSGRYQIMTRIAMEILRLFLSKYLRNINFIACLPKMQENYRYCEIILSKDMLLSPRRFCVILLNPSAG